MSPLVLRVGPVAVPAYTACFMLGFVVVAALAWREAKRRGRLTDETIAVGSAALVGSVVGAKLGMVMFLGPSEFWRLAPTIPAHGATLFGGLFGGYAAVTLAERLLRVDRCTGDLIAPFLPLGQAIARIGNLLAADAYGLPTTLPWGVYQAGAYRHPVQVYELVADLLLFGFLWQRRYTSFRDGELFQLYMVGYSLIRFPLEFLRYQPTPVPLLGLTLVQWFCLAAIAYFGTLLYRGRRQMAAAIRPVEAGPAAAPTDSRRTR